MRQTPMRWFLVFLCVVTVAVAVALERAQFSERSPFSGGTLVPGQPATDFALKTPDGPNFVSADIGGRSSCSASAIPFARTSVRRPSRSLPRCERAWERQRSG